MFDHVGRLVLTDSFRRQPEDSEHLTHMGIHRRLHPCQFMTLKAYRTGHVRVFG
jgi:hypothetical protein